MKLANKFIAVWTSANCCCVSSVDEDRVVHLSFRTNRETACSSYQRHDLCSL